MSYIKFIGEDTKYRASVMPFLNQHGIQSVRIISEPLEPRNVGFRYYDSNDEMLTDYIDYRYHFEGNIYTVRQDTPQHGGPGNGSLPVNTIDRLESALSRVSSIAYQTASNVADITPYTDSKPAYIDDTEVIFDCDKKGSVSAWVTVGNTQIPCEYEVLEGKIRVFFEPLDEVGTVNIQVQ